MSVLRFHYIIYVHHFKYLVPYWYLFLRNAVERLETKFSQIIYFVVYTESCTCVSWVHVTKISCVQFFADQD